MLVAQNAPRVGFDTMIGNAVPLIGPILSEGRVWVQSVRDKRLAAAANALYEAGAVVVAMRALRDSMRALLSPLVGFNPLDWTPERRAAWIAGLRKFVGEATVFGIVNEHAVTLGELRLPSTDIEGLRDELVRLAGNVTHVYEEELMLRSGVGTLADPESELKQRLLGSFHGRLGDYERKGRAEEGDATFQWEPGAPDLLINMYLPALLWLVRHADDSHPEQVEALRALASSLLVTRSKLGDQKLADVVKQTEVVFGKMKGKLYNKYPGLPTLTWMDATPGPHSPRP